MPYEIQPYSGGGYVRPASPELFTDQSWSWLAKQQFDPQRAWKQATSSTRRGTLAGGPSYERFLEFGNEQQWAVYKPRPALTTPLLASDEEHYRRQLGAVEWDSISPFNTVDQLADQVKMATGDDSLGFLRGAEQFLASKSVDPFGMGSTGAPARAADYALAFPIAIMQKLTGAASNPAHPLPQDNVYFKFQADPRYWQAIQSMNPDQLDNLARQTVNQYIDIGTNGYLIEMIRKQFDSDRLIASGLSSGNDAVDYKAIKMLAYQGAAPKTAGLRVGSPEWMAAREQDRTATQDFLAGSPWTAVPFIGTQIARGLDPVTQDELAAWQALPADQRRSMLGNEALFQMGTDFLVALPALSAAGAVITAARGGGVVSRSLASGYDWLLRGAGWTMGAGLGAATTNWALEAWWPGYSEWIGEEVDRARPISGSQLAGAVNAIGYFASGTYGASNLIRGGVKVAMTARRANAFVRASAAAERGMTTQSSLGLPEMRIYSDGFNGARYDKALVATGMDARGLRLSKIKLVLSETVHLARQGDLDTAAAAARGERTYRAELDMLPPEERMLVLNEALMESAGASHAVAEQIIRVLNIARQDPAMFRSKQGLELYRWYKGMARQIDNDLAERYLKAYGPDWVTRTAGAYTETAIKTHVDAALTRMGYDPTQLTGVKGVDGWAKVMRSVHHYEFDYLNGDLHAALEAPGIDGAMSRERGKLSMVSAFHLFGDEVEDVLAVLRGENEAAARAEVERIIRNTIEGEQWFSDHWIPPRGLAREMGLVKPEEVATWIEQVQPALLIRRGKPDPLSSNATAPLNAFHLKLSKDGLWEIAFKPVDAEGRFVSYVRTDSGVFKTPWLDYPLSNADNIELGNRGFAMAKMDAVFRGFRTWRIAEFQRGMLFRSLTGEFPFTASQINAFHQGVLQAARHHGVQPQTVGTVTKGLAGVGQAFADDVERIAADAFGAGPYLTKTGKRVEIDWRKQIAKSYRQSLRLNLTAGLTSHLKTHFGPLGANAAWLSDIGYVNIRFNLSPLFKGGEVVESVMNNGLRGVNAGGDPYVEALFHRAGVGDNYGIAAAEVAYDQALAGLGPRAGGRSRDPRAARQAAGYSWQARQAPQTMEQLTKAAEIQARNEAHQAFVQGGGSVYASPRHALEVELASLTDDAGFILPGNEERADEILGMLDGSLRIDEINAMHHVSQELPSEEWTLDPAELGETYSGAGVFHSFVDPDARPEDRGLWHVTTAVDSVMGMGLKSSRELDRLNIDRPTGLGGGHDRVSVTYQYHHAEAIYERLQMASQAARNQVSASAIGDAFLGMLDYTHYGSSLETWARVQRGAIDAASQMRSSRRSIGPLSRVKNEGELLAALDRAFRTGEAKYTLVQYLDGLLPHGASDGPIAVGLIGNWEEVARADPSQIGILRLGIKKGTTNWAHGPDSFELRIASDDLWLLDQRILDEPIAYGDREGLLAQLRATGHEDGTVIRGMENYQDAIVAELAALDEAAKPLGELAPEPFRSAADDYPGFPDAEYVPYSQIAKYRELDRELQPRMPHEHDAIVAANRARAGIAQVYDDARNSIKAGYGVPSTHPITGDPWPFGDAAKWFGDNPTADFQLYADGAELYLAEERDAAIARIPVPKSYLDEYTAWVQSRIDEGKVPFAEPVILEYDPATKTAMISDGNHKIAIAARLMIDEIPVRVTVMQHRTRPEFAGQPAPQPEFRALPDEPMILPKDDGYIPATVSPSQIFTRRVDQVDNLEDMFGTPEHATMVAEETMPEMLQESAFDQPGFAREAWETLKNPVPMKTHQAALLEIDLLRRGFPSLLRASGMDGVIRVFRDELNLAEHDWLPFLMRDRELATNFHNSGSPEDFEALLAHAGGEKVQGQFDALYASEDWAVLTGLFAIADKAAQVEAFRVHFFNPYRSAIERSLNHPLMGIYPLSWAYRQAREWMRFLYENETISGLKLGMSPAVAIASIVRAQNVAFAQSNPEDLETFIGTSGPFGSTLMIFNLLLPGDWSTIPFPASRTIRDTIRGDLSVRTVENNLLSLGVVRDARLLSEMGGEIKDFAWGPDNPDPNKPLPPWRPHPNTPPLQPSTLPDSFR